nr:MAG TPA: hypothetical protein [Caudoviricetes sp.]
MWNPIKIIRQKIALRRLSNITKALVTFKKLEREGLIHWQVKAKILLLEQSLAISMMTQGKKKFLKFLNLVAQFKNAELVNDAYEQQRIELETAAVRKVQEQTKTKLTDADIQRIRQNAREDMQHIDIKSIMDAIYEFDIMIIRSNAISSADTTQEGGQLVAVGHFDGEKVEMAMWDEIKNDLKAEK